jgi:chemotaxis protein MotB
MARKKEPEKAANHERWLVSYADFITLLFAVFVTLYAMSQTDKQKVEQVAASYRSAFGVTTGAASGKPEVIPKTDMMPIPSMRTQIKNPQKPKAKSDGKLKVQATKKDFKEILVTLEKFMGEKKAQDKVSVEITRRGLVISLKEAGFFDSGSAAIKPTAYELLNKIAEALQPFGNEVSLEGHTDNIPMRSAAFPSNWELSTARATSLAHYFIEKQNFTPEKIAVIGYGEYRPVADNSTEEGRRQNRRVDVVLQGATEGSIEEEAPPQQSAEPPVKELQPPL